MKSVQFGNCCTIAFTRIHLSKIYFFKMLNCDNLLIMKKFNKKKYVSELQNLIETRGIEILCKLPKNIILDILKIYPNLTHKKLQDSNIKIIINSVS